MLHLCMFHLYRIVTSRLTRGGGNDHTLNAKGRYISIRDRPSPSSRYSSLFLTLRYLCLFLSECMLWRYSVSFVTPTPLTTGTCVGVRDRHTHTTHASQIPPFLSRCYYFSCFHALLFRRNLFNASLLNPVLKVVQSAPLVAHLRNDEFWFHRTCMVLYNHLIALHAVWFHIQPFLKAKYILAGRYHVIQ